MSLNNKGSFLVIAAVSLLVLTQHAQCQDRGFSFTQRVVQNNLNSRRAELKAKISQNLASGKLPASEAAALRDKLDSLGDLQLTYSEDSALNDRETNHLVNGYAQVSADLNNYLNSRANLAPGYRWNSRGNRFYRNSVTRALATRIDRAEVEGRVTHREADRMRDKYLSEGPGFNARLNELSFLLNRMDTRSANLKLRNWD